MKNIRVTFNQQEDAACETLVVHTHDEDARLIRCQAFGAFQDEPEPGWLPTGFVLEG